MRRWISKAPTRGNVGISCIRRIVTLSENTLADTSLPQAAIFLYFFDTHKLFPHKFSLHTFHTYTHTQIFPPALFSKQRRFIGCFGFHFEDPFLKGSNPFYQPPEPFYSHEERYVFILTKRDTFLFIPNTDNSYTWLTTFYNRCVFDNFSHASFWGQTKFSLQLFDYK